MGGPGHIICRGVLIWLGCMFPLRIGGYNPLHANCESRLTDIVAETKGFDVVLLAGTGEAHRGGITTSKIDGRTILYSGFALSQMSNRRCGVSIIVGKAHRNARLHEPIEITGKARGRGIAVRIQSGRMGILPTSSMG